MKDYPTLAIPLTTEERDTLTQYETYLQQHLETFFEVGKILVSIRNQKLYRETYKTFEEYCQDRWQISRPRAYQLMGAAEVRDNLSTNVDIDILPQNEAQTRALKKAPPEKQPELWQKAVEQNDGRAPSGRQIIEVYETEFEEKKPDKVKDKVKCDLCGKFFSRIQIVEHNNQNLHTDCYYQVIRAEEEAVRLRAGDQRVQKKCDVQDAVLKWGKAQTPYPEEAIMRWHVIHVQRPDMNQYVREIKQAYLSQYNNDPTLNELIIIQAAKVQETTERMHDVSLRFASNIGGGAFRCEMCHKHIVSGYGFFYLKTNTYRCYHCATAPVIEVLHAPPSDADTCQEETFETRLERCRACLNQYFFVRIDGVLGVTHITEINEHLAKVRGVTYPYEQDKPFPKFACGTFNFELTDLGGFTTARCFESCRENLRNKQPEPKQEKYECFCLICQSWQPHVYSQDKITPHRGVCLSCAQKALYELSKADKTEFRETAAG